MTSIVAIVEGHGEVRAVPILLRRVAQACEVYDLEVPEPIRVQKDRFLRREEEFARMLALAAAKAGDSGHVLVILDADDDCPATLAAQISARAEKELRGRSIGVVLANREFEAWFLAGAASLAGRRGLIESLQPPRDPDAVRDAKGWLSQHMRDSRYHEVLDQPAFTASVDIDSAEQGSRSFRKLLKTVRQLLRAAA